MNSTKPQRIPLEAPAPRRLSNLERARTRRRSWMARLAAGALLLSLAGETRADTPDLPRVTYHSDLRTFSGPLPIKTSFILEIPLHEEAFDEVELVYWKAGGDGGCDAKPPAGGKQIATRQSVDREKKRFNLMIQPLTHSTTYCFKFGFFRLLSDRERAELRKLFGSLIENTRPQQLVTNDPIPMVNRVDKDFKGFSGYTTAGRKRLTEEIKNWLLSDDARERLSALGQPALDAPGAEAERTNRTKALVDAFDRSFSMVRVEARPSGGTTPVPSYTERAGLYISGDVGVMMPIFPATGEIGFAPLVGASFYLVPVDKDEPLKCAGTPDCDFWKRFALTGGIAINVRDSAGTVKGVIGDTGLFVGAGLRVTDYLRLGGGAVFVTQKSQNPLLPGEPVRAAPYVAASVDIDVAGTVKDIYTKGRSAL